MVDKVKFNLEKFKGFLYFNTLCPSEEYYYKISSIDENSMSWWTCKVAFYNRKNDLIYHRSDVLVAWQKPYNQLNFVKWSFDGKYALIFEYKRNVINDYVLLCFQEEITFRIDSKLFECSFLEDVVNLHFDGLILKQKINDFGINPQSFFKQKVKMSLRLWYPAGAHL
ncbi:MAG: hypothetical protein A2033_07905 [Bacteroidetes bacterium GWA2_31_9]|nr:MAG: hypothetical protein A2033_07905 [Bacteroidetes bacterium GWA2_31_9]